MLENHSIQKDCEGITEEELKKLVWATDKLQQEINKNDRMAASRTNIESTAYYIPTREITFSKKLQIHHGFFSNPFYRPVMRNYIGGEILV